MGAYRADVAFDGESVLRDVAGYGRPVPDIQLHHCTVAEVAMRRVLVSGACGALLLTTVLAGSAGAHARSAQTPPGTSARPILSAEEARPYLPDNYLDWSGPYATPVRDPWRPGPVLTPRRHADFVVGAQVGTGGAPATRAHAPAD